MRIPGRITAGGVAIYLVQLNNSLDRDTKRIRDVGAAEAAIRSALSITATDDPSCHFVLFPEVAIPFPFVPEFIRLASLPQSGPRVTIGGVEIASVDEYKALLDTVALDRHNHARLQSTFEEEPGGRPVNACITVIRTKRHARVFLQPKIAPSKFEGALDDLSDPLRGDFISFFCAEDLGFATVICSDFFNPPQGETFRIIDRLSWELLHRKTKDAPHGLDLLVVIQHNPSPDHELFIESMSRLYDTGPYAQSNLTTVFVNAVVDGRMGGLSRVIFHRNQSLLEGALQSSDEAPKQLDAPVVGLEFGSESRIVRLRFERLPPWNPYLHHHPLHVEAWSADKSGWATELTPSPRLVVTTRHLPSVGSESLDDVASKLSEVGHFSEAILVAKTALGSLVGSQRRIDRLRSARLHHFVGTQERHRGANKEAIRHYAYATAALQEIGAWSIEEQLLSTKIRGAQVMVSTYLIGGECAVAREEYSRLLRDLDEYLLSASSTLTARERRRVNAYILHGRRQRAEMTRLLGEYRAASVEFTDIARGYGRAHPRERAYSLLGRAESHRMLCEFPQAERWYDETWSLAEDMADRRLMGRVSRNRAELLRTRAAVQNSPELLERCYEELDILANLSVEAEYAFGKIYHELITGGCALLQGCNSAIGYFERALDLTRDGSRPVLRLEYAHASLGIAECLGRRGTRAQRHLADARRIYDIAGLSWGIERARSARRTPSSHPAFDHAALAISAGRPLFLNLP